MANAELISSIFDGVFGGLNQGYQSQKKIQRDERARQDDLALSRDEQNLRKRHMDGVDAERQRKTAETKAERAAQDAIINGLSPDNPLRKALEARRAGLDATPKDFEPKAPDGPLPSRSLTEIAPSAFDSTFGAGSASPSGFTPGAAPKYSVWPEGQAATDKATAATAAAAKKRADDLATFEDRERIRAKHRRNPVPITPRSTDSPLLPNGVKSYLSTLPGKYAADPTAANEELTRALPDLMRDHPGLDPRQLRSAFNALFPKAPQAKENNLWPILSPGAPPGAPTSVDGGRVDAMPTKTGPSIKDLRDRTDHPGPPASQTAAQAKAASESPELEALRRRAETLLARYKAEQNDGVKEDLRAELAQLREEARALKAR